MSLTFGVITLFGRPPPCSDSGTWATSAALRFLAAILSSILALASAAASLASSLALALAALLSSAFFLASATVFADGSVIVLGLVFATSGVAVGVALSFAELADDGLPVIVPAMNVVTRDNIEVRACVGNGQTATT